MNSNLYSKLSDPEYRKAFVASQINIGIPFQLRALLKASNWTQQELADKCEMLQPRISAMLKPGGAKFTIETLRRLAAAFDVALMVKFVPFSELVKWSEDFDPERFHVLTFEKEINLAGNDDDLSLVEDPADLTIDSVSVDEDVQFAIGTWGNSADNIFPTGIRKHIILQELTAYAATVATAESINRRVREEMDEEPELQNV